MSPVVLSRFSYDDAFTMVTGRWTWDEPDFMNIVAWRTAPDGTPAALMVISNETSPLAGISRVPGTVMLRSAGA